MSINNALTPFPYLMGQLNNISPLTYRDGATYLKVLEKLIAYVQETQTPEIQALLEKYFTDFQAGITNAEQTIISIKNGWQTLFDGFMGSIVGQLEALNDEAVSNLVKQEFGTVSELSRTLKTMYDRVYTPEFYGAIGKNNPADAAADTLGWQLALNAARDNRGTVQAMGVYHINNTLQWDVIANVMGHHRLNSVITDPEKYLVRVWSSDNGDVASPIRQRAIAWRGGIFWGNRLSKGINFTGEGEGANTSTNKVAHLSMEHCVIKNFLLGVNHGNHSYMNTFLQCNIQGNVLGILHANEGNSGERLEFIACDITGNERAFELPSGQSFHFTNCSFSYNTGSLGRIVDGSVFFTNCHIEFNKPTMTYLTLEADGAYVSFSDCRWLISENANSNETPIIELRTLRTKAVINGGHLTGSALTKYFSKGIGSMISDNLGTRNFSALVPFLNDTNQSLMDPSFESTSIVDDWVFGDRVTGVLDTGASVSGAKSLKITCSDVGSNLATLFIPVNAGDRVLTAFDFKISGATSAFSVNWRWANGKKTSGPADLAVSVRNATTVGTVWNNLKQGGVSYESAPSWARYMVMTFVVNSIAVGTQLNIDDIKTSIF